MEAFVDHYAILNVLHEAEQGEIARAYRAKIKKVHPDRNRELEGAEELTRLVITARDVLLDPLRRRNYDVEWRARRRTPPSTYAQAERDAAQQRADARARREREAERRAAETDARAAREAAARATEARAQAERASKVRAAEARAAEARAAEARAAEARAQTKRIEARRARYTHVRRPPEPSPVAQVLGAVVLAGLFGLGIAAIADALSDKPPS